MPAKYHQWAGHLASGRLASLTELHLDTSSEPLGADQVSTVTDAIRALVEALPCTPTAMTISKFTATAEFVAGLPQLPSVEAVALDLQSCVGGADPAPEVWPAASLAQLLPASCRRCSLGTRLQQAEVEAFIFGAPGSRTAERPLEIRVVGQEPAWVESLNAIVRELGTYPHVSVVSCDHLYWWL